MARVIFPSQRQHRPALTGPFVLMDSDEFLLYEPRFLAVYFLWWWRWWWRWRRSGGGGAGAAPGTPLAYHYSALFHLVSFSAPVTARTFTAAFWDDVSCCPLHLFHAHYVNVVALRCKRMRTLVFGCISSLQQYYNVWTVTLALDCYYCFTASESHASLEEIIVRGIQFANSKLIYIILLLKFLYYT